MLTALMPVKSYHPSYLREAAASMLAQTSPDWRLLVIAEDDRPAAALPAEARVELVPNEGRALAGAFNTGIRRAQTDFVAILLGDDLWEPDAVDVLSRRIAASPQSDFFHSSRRIVDDNGEPISAVHKSRAAVTLDEFRNGSSPVKHLLCWRRELALEIGGMDESLGSVGVDDFDFPWSMAEAGARFEAVPECLYVYRDHRASFRLTTHLPLSHHKREIARIMRKHGVGRDAIDQALARAERGYLRQCLYRNGLDRRLRPRRRGGWRERYR